MNEKLWWTKNALKPSVGRILASKAGLEEIFQGFRQQSFEIESDAVDQSERFQ
jgi:hypothetical protein